MILSRSAPPALRVLRVFFALFALFSLLAVTAAAAEPSSRNPKQTSPRGARDVPSAEQLAEIRRVVELVRESRDQLPQSKLTQLAQQLRQLRARIGATRAADGDGELEKEEDSGSTEAASRVYQVRSLSGGFNNDLRAHTLDDVKSTKSTLFYDDVQKGVIEAPPPKDGGRDGYHSKDASDSHHDGDYYDDSFSNSYHDNKGDVVTHGNGGVSIAVGVSSGLHAFDGKTQSNPARHDGGKRVIGVGSSYPVPHDVRSYGTPKPGGSGGSPHKIHPSISDTSTLSPHLGPAHDSFGDARHVSGTRGGSGVFGFGPPKGAVLSSDAYADSTTTRSFLDYSHQAQGQLFHENYVRGGFQSAVVPPGDPHAATVHIAPAVGPHAGTVVFPAASPHVVRHVSPHVDTFVAPPGPSTVSVHIGLGGHHPVVEYTPPAHVRPEEYLAAERPRSGGKIIFPVSGPHHAEASYVAPPPEVHVTHVEEHETSNHATPVHVTFGGKHVEPHVTHVEEHVYEEHHEPHSSHVSEYHEPQSSHVDEYHNTHSYSHKDDYHSSSHSLPHDASQYGPPHSKPIPVPYVPQHVSHARPVHVTHYKKRPGFFDSLLRPFWRLKSLFFGGGRGHARPVSYESIETPPHNYYEYGAAVSYPKKCRCIDNKSVLGVLVAGVAGAGLVAYVYALTTNNTNGLGRAVDGPDRAAMARLMLQEACSLGADAERMWNGTVWIGDGEDGEEEDGQGDDEEWVQTVKTDKQALKRRRNGLQEATQLSLKSLGSAKRSKQELLEQELQASVYRTARQLDKRNTPSSASHQVVKKAAASVTSLSSPDAQGESLRAKRSATVLDQATLASSSADLPMYSFDGMDIPMRRSTRDPGLPFPLQPRKAVFRPPAPRPFTPDIPDTYSPDRPHSSSDNTDAFFNYDFLDSLNIPDASYSPHRFSRRMDLLDDVTDPSHVDRNDSDLPLSFVESLIPDDTSSSNLSSNASSSAVKATRDLPDGGDLLSAAMSLLPMVDLGPFQPLTRAFQAVSAEERASGKGVRRGTPYRKRMKNMFVGLRQFVTKGIPSLMKRTAYDPHCGCIPLTLLNVGLVGAPIFAVVASGLVLTFLILQLQTINQGNGRKRSEDASASATEELASALETLLTAEETAADNSSEATRLRSYYRQIVTPVAVAGRFPQLAALSGALEATSIECSRYYMCEMAMSSTSSGEPFDIGGPLLSLPVSWMLTSTQGGEFGQYCSSAVIGGSGRGNCALLYPGCNEV